MNFIKNGDFESGTTKPWTTMDGGDLDFAIVPWNNKKWLLTNGFGGPQNGNFQQIIPKSDDLRGVHFRLTLTAKALPTGGTMPNDAQSDNDVNRLTGELIAYLQLYPTVPGIWQPAGSLRVSVKEQTFTHRFVLDHSTPIDYARLLIVNWGLGDTDKADILVTDIQLELDNPDTIPEKPAKSARTIDLSSIGLGAVNVSPMKEVK